MDNSSNIFSYFVGGLALVSTIVSISLYYRAYLPGAQMKLLDELIQETRSMYEKADADGLLPAGSEDRILLQAQLTQLEKSTTGLREMTYNATTLFEECMALLRGVSKMIMDTAEKVKKLRAFLLTTTEEQRRRRDSAQSSSEYNSTAMPVLSTTIQPISRNIDSASSICSQTITIPVLDSDDLSLSPTLVTNKVSWSLRRPLTFVKRWMRSSTEENAADGKTPVHASIETLPV